MAEREQGKMSAAVYWQEDYNYRHETFTHHPTYEILHPPPLSMSKPRGPSANSIKMPHQEDENSQLRRRVPMAVRPLRWLRESLVRLIPVRSANAAAKEKSNVVGRVLWA